jgi:hypothetical protein
MIKKNGKKLCSECVLYYLSVQVNGILNYNPVKMPQRSTPQTSKRVAVSQNDAHPLRNVPPYCRCFSWVGPKRGFGREPDFFLGQQIGVLLVRTENFVWPIAACPYRKCHPARTPLKSATFKKMKLNLKLKPSKPGEQNVTKLHRAENPLMELRLAR